MRIKVNQVSFQVDGKILLQPTSLELQSGCTHVLLGPNGAGKSTLLKIISGYLQTETGEVLCDEIDVRSMKPVERARKMAVLTQRHELDFPFTVRQVVAMGREPHQAGPGSEAIIDEMLERLRLEPERIYTSLSGGERQLTQLARVFTQVRDSGDGGVLLLDEPMTALDLKHQSDVVQLLKQFSALGTSQLIVMHDINLAAEIADQVTLMSHGKIVASGNPEEAITIPNLERTFATPMIEVGQGSDRFFKTNLE